jgi:alpha-tubulin suppressor-like RCC1 family protein
MVGIVAIAAGGSHTCALTLIGSVLCWGSDEHGQLGDGPVDSSGSQYVEVQGLSNGVVAITAGFAHTCALTYAGRALCWGLDDYGQNGGGVDTSDKQTPIQVSGLASGVTAIAAGFNHTCAIVEGAGVKCWGRDTSGQLGDGANNTNKPTPVAVVGLETGVQAVAAGGSHSCALREGGAYCWGDDTWGQLGDDATAGSRAVPTPVRLLDSGIQAIVAGYNHTCALRATGTVRCWGVDGSGQIGDGENNAPKYTPELVPTLLAITSLAAGQDHTCASGADGAFCWGSDLAGQLGEGTLGGSANAPVAVTGVAGGGKTIAAGRVHTCLVTQESALLCWGLNTSGQVGDGTLETRSAPAPVLGPQYYRALLPQVAR